MTHQERFILQAAKAFADPHRLVIWQAVVLAGSLPLSQLALLTGLSQPSVSFHVKQFTDCQLLSSYKQGRTVHLQVNVQALQEFLAFFQT